MRSWGFQCEGIEVVWILIGRSDQNANYCCKDKNLIRRVWCQQYGGHVTGPP